MPIFYYNDACSYCRQWARWCEGRVDSQVQFEPLPEDDPKTTPKFLTSGGVVLEGVHGIVEMLALSPSWRWPRFMYRFVPGVAVFSEWFFSYLSQCPVCAERISGKLLRVKKKR